MRTFQIGLLSSSVAAAIVLSSAEDWQPVELLALLGLLTLLSGAFPLQVKEVKASGSFLGLVLTMALLGPAPAVALGVITQLPQSIATRARLDSVLCNVSGYAAFSLIGALALRPVPETAALTLAGAVFVVFIAANFLNFFLVALDIRVTEGDPILRNVRDVFLPVLPVQIASAALTASIAYGYARYGIEVIVFLAVAGLVFQYLLHLAFESMRRGEQLERRTHELASLQVGLLTTVINTLSLRDKMTARHSAAVARYSRAIARELGLDEREQDIVHTAGLLHDIGKFILPDRILKANVPLTDEDWMLIKRHPQQGARVVSALDGYGPVADIILAHHERIDGKGYPRGLKGEEIPRLSRIISVSDTYDVMTARDSYRTPMSSADAIAELRRVAGKQLDAEFVEVFIELIEGNDVSFQHSEASDFEKELALESRIAVTASPESGSDRFRVKQGAAVA